MLSHRNETNEELAANAARTARASRFRLQKACVAWLMVTSKVPVAQARLEQTSRI